MIKPIASDTITAPTTRTKPISTPIKPNVKVMAKILIAGPAKRKVTAGPMPAPFFRILANIGRTEQEQTAKIDPDTEAIKYDVLFFALGPKYFITAPWDINCEIAPDKKKAMVSIIILLRVK